MNASELSLRVLAEDDALVWEVVNGGSSVVRLWQQSNSWGWPMPRLHVDDHTLTPAQKVWTRNFPSSTEVGPGESARYTLRAGDFDPAGLQAVQALWEQPLVVQGELHCEPSPEASEYDVWCGTLRGERQELPPPHAWLRAQSSG